MNINTYQNYYFLGIGGIGMSALARHFNSQKKWVGGYDKTKTPLTELLEAEGIYVHFDEELGVLEPLNLNPENTLIIYTPAVPKQHKQLIYFQNQGFKFLKRAQVLGILSENSDCMAIAGTHGKTTTSTLLAHLFRYNGYDVNAFLGGIATNYNTNYLSGQSKRMVVEADEFDQSFLQLHPQYAVITSTDADHLDIYGNEAHLKETFKKFAALSRSKGSLVAHNLCGIEADYYYGKEEHCHFAALNIRIQNGRYIFDLKTPMGLILGIKMPLPGYHNVENATAAAAIALLNGLNPEQVKRGIESYQGVKRRFEYILNRPGALFIDDYAHHPEEIKATLHSLKMMYPNEKLHVIFQPHLFSRTRDFMEAFAQSLSMAYDITLLEIYPAREEPIEGVNSTELLKHISIKNKRLLAKDELLIWLKNHKPKLLVTLGAGDIDRLVEPIKKLYGN